jgi:ABC-type amino acid transport substrate-binding protein
MFNPKEFLMQFKIIVLFSLLVGSIVGSYIVFNTMKIKRDSTAFVVGTAAGYAPFVSINERGEYEGFDIDFANALAAAMEKKLVLKDLGSMASLIIALEQGSIDAAIWGLSITQDRLKKFAMVHYQGQGDTTFPLIFWKEIPAGITTFSDMKGKTVCAEPASSQGTILSKYTEVIALPTEKVDDALLNIHYGKADAAFLDPAIAKKFKAKCPDVKILDIPLDKEDQVQGNGVLIKKDAVSLIDQVQRAVNQLKDNGTIKQYEKKWNIE